MAVLKKILPRKIYLRHVGRHEEGSLELWREYARQVPRDRGILDVGAFHGIYALAAREENLVAPIYAFEPNPTSLERLTEACRGQRIQVEPVAVAETSGTVSFLTDDSRSQMSESGSSYVPSISLDEWRAERQVDPSLIKIDTEGAEVEIFRGAAKLLKECQPVILCEVLTDEAGEAVMEVLPKTYSYFKINENRGPEERDRITRDEWRNKNWLLVPSEIARL